MPGLPSIPSLPLASIALLAVGCGVSPPPVAEGATPGTILDQTEGLIQSDQCELAQALLESQDEDSLIGEDRARYQLLLATSLFRNGEAWEGYREIESFPDDFLLSSHQPAVEELEFRIGKQLLNSDASYWIFGSDREDGEIVLAHFYSRYPANENVPEALKLLGELAFEEGKYELARDRFRDLRANHPRSEWAPLAQFMLTMAAFRDLEGPAYDFRQMSAARNELRDYLELGPERPEFRAEAETALATVTGWMADRRLENAEFYRTIENEFGERQQLEQLLREQPDSPQAETARQRLQALQPAEGGPDR